MYVHIRVLRARLVVSKYRYLRGGAMMCLHVTCEHAITCQLSPYSTLLLHAGAGRRAAT